MSDRTATLARIAHRASAKLQGGSITAARGSQTATMDATFGTTEFHVETTEAVRIVRSDRDFIVLAAAYAFGGTASGPARGDRITSDGQTFEVMAPGNENVFSLCEPAGIRIRVHTKRVA